MCIRIYVYMCIRVVALLLLLHAYSPPSTMETPFYSGYEVYRGVGGYEVYRGVGGYEVYRGVGGYEVYRGVGGYDVYRGVGGYEVYRGVGGFRYHGRPFWKAGRELHI